MPFKPSSGYVHVGPFEKRPEVVLTSTHTEGDPWTTANAVNKEKATVFQKVEESGNGSGASIIEERVKKGELRPLKKEELSKSARRLDLYIVVDEGDLDGYVAEARGYKFVVGTRIPFTGVSEKVKLDPRNDYWPKEQGE